MFRKAQQSVAHQSMLPSSFSLGNRDLKSLQEVINSEKEFIKSNTRSAQDFHKVADSIKNWANAEGEDLQDIVGKLSLLLEHYTTAQTRFNAHLSTIRQHFKSIRTREESLAELKSRKKALGTKIEGVEKKLAKMGPENKELMRTTTQLKELRGEMEGLRVEVQAEEAAIGDFKRRTAKEAMGIKCGGLLEFAEKMTIIAEIGKQMIEEIPLEYTHPGMPRAEYHGAHQTDELLSQATRSLADVGFAPAGHSSSATVRNDTSGLRGSEWDDSGVADQAYDEDAAAYADQYDGGYAADESEVPQIPDADNSTPIYATHSSIGRQRGESLGTSADPTSTDNVWTRSADDAATSTIRTKPSTSTPIADQFASRSPDEIQVGITGLSVVGADRSATNDSYHRNVSHTIDGDYTSNMPPSSSYTNGSSRTAAAVVPPRISTPSPQDGAPETPDPSSPAAMSAAQDDASYFQSVGSTRAAQQAIRRPISPSSSSFHASNSLTSHLANPPAIHAGPYEPQAEGRKMTAAAFRKGFNRVPSSQQMGASGSNLGGAHGGDGHYGQEESNAIAPLAIRKRYSAVPGQTSGHNDEQHPAPPYDEADRHQSVYGGYTGADDQHKVVTSSRPVPGQYYSASPYGSRPTSAADWRPTNGYNG